MSEEHKKLEEEIKPNFKKQQEEREIERIKFDQKIIRKRNQTKNVRRKILKRKKKKEKKKKKKKQKKKKTKEKR